MNVSSYELTPSGKQISFYGKAKVVVSDNGDETLISYSTPVIKRNSNGVLERLWDGWSATTGRHIKEFCGLNKAEYLELSLNS